MAAELVAAGGALLGGGAAAAGTAYNIAQGGRPRAAKDKEHAKILQQTQEHALQSLGISQKGYRENTAEILKGIKEAGLSASIMYNGEAGGGGAGGAGGGGGKGAPTGSTPTINESTAMDMASAAMQLKQMQEQNKLLKTEQELKQQELRHKEERHTSEEGLRRLEAESKEVQNELQKIEKEVRSATKEAEIEKAHNELTEQAERIGKLIDERAKLQQDTELDKEAHRANMRKMEQDFAKGVVEILIQEAKLKGQLNDNDLHFLKEGLLREQAKYQRYITSEKGRSEEIIKHLDEEIRYNEEKYQNAKGLYRWWYRVNASSAAYYKKVYQGKAQGGNVSVPLPR